ncbi:hypothetical protein [Cytobacillus oceanisediminis]|uniref:hypothetical protein n=1 Tax=Cytobacillus oceanisediminis TaxID=665099 RepID=UPI0037363DD8
MNFRKVIVKYIWRGEVCEEFPDKGVYYEDRGLVIRCDQWGEVKIYQAEPVEGTDVVIVAEHADDFLEDNQDFFLDLIMSGGATE